MTCEQNHPNSMSQFYLKLSLFLAFLHDNFNSDKYMGFYSVNLEKNKTGIIIKEEFTYRNTLCCIPYYAAKKHQDGITVINSKM